MIECVDENIWYKKKKKRIGKKIKNIFIFLLVICIVFLYAKQIISSITFYSSKEIEAISTLKINEVIISNDIKFNYDDIVKIEKNNNGDITYIETKSVLVNEIGSDYSVKIKEVIDKEFNNGIKIPWTAFTGIKFLSGYGKDVLFKTLEVSSVNAEIKGDFIGQGINQTLHRIFLEIELKTNLILPLNKREIINTKKVLLTENVIIGKIPEIYLQK